MRKGQIFVAAFGVLALGLSHLAAHDIPNDVLVQMFVKSEPQHVVLLVRVPLSAIRVLGDAASLWLADNISVYENGARLSAPRLLAVKVSLPSDTSFRSFEEASEHLRGTPLPVATDLYWNQALLDVRLDVPIASPPSQLAIQPTFARLGVRVQSGRKYAPDARVRCW